jgi:hypothetical protein
LDQIEDAQLRFTRIHGEDEVQRGVVTVDQTNVTAPKL